ncbi:unnamed protein product [Caenorhabditis auriculariae]|uniref:Receptor L-domain domain-containing protein n=1 Tax=Caenorhabditis auriculariae TaxID=2777116 RepID=A0A8S1HRV6_9PELO|nr:unnamed protein product [Caenorhabditis auriculariae]
MGCTKVRQKRQIFYISMTLFCTLSSVLAEEVCCTKSAWAYPTGEAVPPECDKNGVTCTEGLIHVEKPLKSSKSIAGLLGRVKKSGPITILDNTDLVISIDMLEEIVHNGPGPAVHLRDPKLADGTCFTSLKRIIVDEPLRYCKKRDLLLFEGNVTPEVKDLLEKAANETLSGCESLTTPIPTSATLNWTTTIRSLPTTSNGIAVVPPLCVQSSAAASAHEKLKCPSKNGILAAGIIVIVILLVLLGISMSVSIKLYFFRKQEDAAFAAFGNYII